MGSEDKTLPITVADIKKIIAHQLLREKNGNGFILNLSRGEVDMSPEAKKVILHKLGELLPKSVPMEISQDSQVTNIVKQIPNMEINKFITQSHIIAKELQQAQASVSRAKDGVLIVIHAIDTDARDVVLIIKSEFREEIQAFFSSNHKTVIELLENIIFTKTNYYKIGAFLSDKSEWHCRLWDSVAKSGKKSTAKYFYTAFLRLTMMQSNATRTLDFYEYSKEFIGQNYQGRDILSKMEFLSTYLKSDPKLVEIDKFAKIYLSETKNKYVDYMCERAHLSGNFVKEMSLTEKKIKIAEIQFDGGIKVYMPHGRYGHDFVVLSDKDIPPSVDNDEQWTYVKIRGKIKSGK